MDKDNEIILEDTKPSEKVEEKQLKTETEEKKTEKTYTEKEYNVLQALLETEKSDKQALATTQYNAGIKAAAKKAGIDTTNPKNIDEWLVAVEKNHKDSLSAIELANKERDESIDKMTKLEAKIQKQEAENLALANDCDPKKVKKVVTLALTELGETEGLKLEDAVKAILEDEPAFKRKQAETIKDEKAPKLYNGAAGETEKSKTKIEDLIKRMGR